MAGALTNDAKERVLNWLFVDAESTPAPETPTVVRLMSANGDAEEFGTEVTGDSYIEVEALFSFTSESPGVFLVNTFDVEFNSISATAAVSVVGIEIWDSSESFPLRIAYATFTSPYLVAAGDPLLIATGQIKVKLL